MKLDCGLTPYSKRRKEERDFKRFKDNISRWHRWFAWWPVQLGDHDCRWLEYVERRGDARIEIFNGVVVRWEYRAVTNG